MRWALVALACLGCELDAGPVTDLRPADARPSVDTKIGMDMGGDALIELDAAAVEDASVEADAAVDLDAATASPDAERLPMDAAMAPDVAIELDAASEPDADDPDMSWGACVANGQPGDCLHVDDCEAPNVSIAGFCPGPAQIRCCVAPPDQPPVLDCDPDDRPQPNAGLAEGAGEGGCPDGMVAVGGFCIDRYEASLVRADGRPWSPYHHPGNADVVAVSLADAVPQGYIDGVAAERACVAAGKRLCTNDEWLRACRGAEGRTYPYGDVRRDGVCNDARARHPAVELFPDDPNPFDRIQHACINQLADGLAPTGEHPGCVTPEGVFDLMGNLHEWTSDPTGTFRGGFYVDTVRNGQGCLYRTTAHNRQHWDYSTGFRCCADR